MLEGHFPQRLAETLVQAPDVASAVARPRQQPAELPYLVGGDFACSQGDALQVGGDSRVVEFSGAARHLCK